MRTCWGWHFVSSPGAHVAGASMLLLLWIVWRTFRSGERAAANPWGEGATTLEWQVASPPPFHTFEEPPRVR